MTKIVWRVDPKPTGRYRSFQKRSWPHARWGTSEGPSLSYLYPDPWVDYWSRITETVILKVRVADHREKSFIWRTLKKRATGLAEAKEIVRKFYEEHPDWLPKEKENG